MAVAIVAMVGVLIYGAFLGMTRSRQTMVQVADRYQQGASPSIAWPASWARPSSPPTSPSASTERAQDRLHRPRSGGLRRSTDAFANVRLAVTPAVDQAEISTSPRAIATGNLDLVRRVSRYLDDDPGRAAWCRCGEHQSFELKYMDRYRQVGETWDSSRAPPSSVASFAGVDHPLARRRSAPHQFRVKATLSVAPTQLKW